jgi:hypothetical protein
VTAACLRRSRLAARSTIPAEFTPGRRASSWYGWSGRGTRHFVIAEALASAAKHSHARRCVIGLRHGHRTLRSGSPTTWAAPPRQGPRAARPDHRLNAGGGRLTVTSP